MIAGYLIAFGPWLPILALFVTIAVCWLIMWLMEKGGWRRLIGVTLTVFIGLSVLLLIAGA